jgi:exosortase
LGHALRRASPFLLLAGSVWLLYGGVIRHLVHDWINDENYSHGFLIVPLALYFVWERRKRLASLPMAPSNLGLVIVLGSLGVLLAGVLGAELFLTRVSLVGLTAGSIAFLLGWRALRVLAFPVALLMLMIPIPALIFNQIAFPLQLLASQVGETALRTLGVPVLREGNVIVLANTSLEVAEACSGIRSLISLLTLGIVYGYFSDPRGGVRVAIALSTIPIAIASNGARVAGTGIAAHYIGPEAAEGFFHTFSGWLMFVAAFLMLFVIVRLIIRLAPRRIADDAISRSVVAVRT